MPYMFKAVRSNKRREAKGRAVPLNSVVYLQIVLIFCFLKSTWERACVY